MRLTIFLLTTLAVCAGVSTASADTLPVGTFSLNAQTTTTGIHQSIDQGTLSGTLVFDANSQITFANLLFQDTTDGLSFSYTQPGASTYVTLAHLLSAEIKNPSNPVLDYFFSIRTLGNGTYGLTCGVDCATDVLILDAMGRPMDEAVFGTLTATPEPPTFALLAIGLLGLACVFRTRLSLAVHVASKMKS